MSLNLQVLRVLGCRNADQCGSVHLYGGKGSESVYVKNNVGANVQNTHLK